jgi:hypothetical protein
MASESRAGLPSSLISQRGVVVRGRTRRARLRAARSGAGLRVVPLFIDGVPRLRVYVALGGMVDVAVHELGARLTEVEPSAEETPADPSASG